MMMVARAEQLESMMRMVIAVAEQSVSLSRRRVMKVVLGCLVVIVSFVRS